MKLKDTQMASTWTQIFFAIFVQVCLTHLSVVVIEATKDFLGRLSDGRLPGHAASLLQPLQHCCFDALMIDDWAMDGCIPVCCTERSSTQSSLQGVKDGPKAHGRRPLGVELWQEHLAVTADHGVDPSLSPAKIEQPHHWGSEGVVVGTGDVEVEHAALIHSVIGACHKSMDLKHISTF